MTSKSQFYVLGQTEGSQPVSPTLHTCQVKSDHSVARKNDDWWVLTIDWSLIIDDWWLIIDDWWLMIDDWWLMTDNMKWTLYCLPQGGTPLGVSYILHFILYQSSIISHQSSIINHQSSMNNDQSIVSTHQSSIFLATLWSLFSWHVCSVGET